ncbi:CPBP family intramembrane metalloprotease [bacterium]|nr:CPBP family intramembrane metalloprotease [bacterium]
MSLYTIDWTWTALDFKICLPILLTLVFFSIYWFTSKSKKIRKRFYNKYDHDQASLKHIFFTKYFGFFSMGVFPTIICLFYLPDLTLADLGLTLIYETSLFSLLWILGLSILIVPLVYFSAKNPKNLLNYPQIRAKVWTKKMICINALGWFLYLFGYEFLFRGVLLIPLLEPLGMWPAITINIALYSATHIPKGLDETIGAIPLGFVLSLLTISSGTIWIAFIVHVVMAWTNTFTALKFHPDMKIQL